jgi:hypothetical protein
LKDYLAGNGPKKSKVFFFINDDIICFARSNPFFPHIDSEYLNKNNCLISGIIGFGYFQVSKLQLEKINNNFQIFIIFADLKVTS